MAHLHSLSAIVLRVLFKFVARATFNLETLKVYKGFIGWVQYLINKKATVRDFPAALAAKILRHPKRTQNIKSFCGAEREPAKQACYESCEASSCVFHKKRLAEGTHPPRPPRPDKSKFIFLP